MYAWTLLQNKTPNPPILWSGYHKKETHKTLLQQHSPWNNSGTSTKLKTKPINSWFVPVINRFFIFEAISKYRKQSDNKYSSWWRPISASSNCILCSDMYDYAPSLYTHKSFFILHYPWHHKFWTEGVEGSGILCVNCSLSWRFMHEACIWCIAAMTVTHFSSHWVNSLQLNQQRLQLKIYKYVLWI